MNKTNSLTIRGLEEDIIELQDPYRLYYSLLTNYNPM